ncbi:MAG TPA: FtsX-like permease family protein [Bdellovibrionales bacterium]|nr:FtsX-like permease family protein [Bdellovibrionales bacterium]
MVWIIFKHYLLSKRSSALIRAIAWLCIGGVGIGVLAMTVVLSVMNGFDSAIRDRLLAVEPHLVVHMQDAHAEPAPDEENVLQLLRGRGQAHAYESRDVIVRTLDGLYGGAVAKGIDSRVLGRILREVSKTRREQQRDDSLPTGSESGLQTFELAPGEVTMGADLAGSIGVFEGDEVVLASPEALLLPSGEIPTYERVRVKSILRSNVPDIDAQMIYYGREHGLARLKGTIERGVEVRIKDPTDYADLMGEIKSQGFEVESWEQRNSALFHSLRMEKLAIGLFLGLSILIASFSIITVLVLLVTHKKSEIGLLMAMGLAPSKTRNVFAGVGLLLSGIGLFGGLILGLLICVALDKFSFIELPSVYYDTRIPVEIDTVVVAGTIAGSLVVALLASWVPAWLATRVSPTEAIRSIPADGA